MRTHGTLFALTAMIAFAAAPAHAQQYKLDEAHMAFYFKISHLGYSDTFGRFNKASGDFTLSGSDSTFSLTIDADSIDTGFEKRDDHLRNPDFLNVKQFPKITFKSTDVSVSGDTWTVTGDFTMHGVTKPLTLELKKHAEGQGPDGKVRTGFSTEAVIQRSAFGMDKMLPAIGDDVTLMISIELIKQ